MICTGWMFANAASINALSSFPRLDAIKLQLVEAGLVECLLDVVAQTVDGEREEDIAQLKTASDLMVLLLLGGKHEGLTKTATSQRVHMSLLL